MNLIDIDTSSGYNPRLTTVKDKLYIFCGKYDKNVGIVKAHLEQVAIEKFAKSFKTNEEIEKTINGKKEKIKNYDIEKDFDKISQLVQKINNLKSKITRYRHSLEDIKRNISSLKIIAKDLDEGFNAYNNNINLLYEYIKNSNSNNFCFF